MKETIKASIGGYAFTLDADAYEILKSYLDNLKLHFSGKDDGEEIISDIEARMCELLQMKSSKQESIITKHDAQSIIEIMGNPVDFEDGINSSEEKNERKAQKTENQINKKLYRDTDNAVLGGVCAGLAKYFNFDTVFVRIAFAMAIAFGEIILDNLGAYILISYLILWVAMPKAKTMEQKIAMSGDNPTIEDIENRTAKISKRSNNPIGRVLGSIIRITSGIVLICIGLSFLIASCSVMFFPTELDLPSINELLNILNIYSGSISYLLMTIWLLPSICFIYLGIKTFTKISSKDIIILGVSFFIWLGACSYIVILTARQAKNYKEHTEAIERIPLNTSSDYIYIKLNNKLDEASCRWRDGGNGIYVVDGDPRSWFLLPSIRINQDSIYKNVEMKITKIAFGKNERIAESKALKSRFPYEIKDSIIQINPLLLNKNNPWNREYFEIEINCPMNKTIELDKIFTYKGENYIGWQFN